jgi:putative ABC transport system substrate-binding protein
VIAVDYDPEATGHVASLARPGGRVTGVSAMQSILPAKRLEPLEELLPAARRFAVLSDTASTGQLGVARAGARRLGVKLHDIGWTGPVRLRKSVRRRRPSRADALRVIA